MKIRSGFVSNSSSSSFVIMTTKKNYEKTLEKVDSFVQVVVKSLFNDTGTIDGVKMVGAGTFCGRSDEGTFDNFEIDEENVSKEALVKWGENYYEAFDSFVNELGKENVLTYSIDC